MMVDRAEGDLRVEMMTIDQAGLTSLRPEWEALEERSSPPPYLWFEWMAGWADVYEPRGLRVLRIASLDGGTVGLGLLEERSGRRWRFAGGSVTPVRGILSRSEDGAACWRALAAWLRERRWRWTSIEADGVQPEALTLPAASWRQESWLALELPESFEEYLQQRPSGVRRSLRTAERQGAVARQASRELTPSAIDAFIRLHTARAKAKGEAHKHIDARLGQLLKKLASARTSAVKAFTLTRGSAIIAVTVRLDRGRSSWFYNAGFDPQAGRISPGVVIEIASIQDAIRTGQTTYDLGPGDYRYKRELGGEEHRALFVRSTSPTIGGELFRMYLAALRLVSRSPRARAAVHKKRAADQTQRVEVSQ